MVIIASNVSSKAFEYCIDSESKFGKLLQKRDFKTIIHDSDLFWMAYCKAAAFTLQTFLECTDAIKRAQSCIENIRQYFVKAIENDIDLELIAIDDGNNIFIKEAHCDAIDFNDSEGISKSYFLEHIESTLQKLASLFNLYVALKLQCAQQPQVVYLIIPPPIPTQQDMHRMEYEQYQTQEQCDWTLVSKESKTIKVHSLMLGLYGGDVLLQMLKANMKETHEHTISFEEYKHMTVLAFLDYVYLGGKEFIDRTTSSSSETTFDVLDLLALSHQYQITGLIDCCTNLISLYAKKEEVGEIRAAANLYDNEHLKQLCEYLAPSKKETLIEV